MDEGMHIIKQSDKPSSEFQLEGAVKDKVIKDVSARMLQDGDGRYVDFIQVAKSLDLKDPIGETVDLILSDYGNRNIKYARIQNLSPTIVNHSVDLSEQRFNQRAHYSLLLTDHQISIPVSTFLAAVAIENGVHPSGFKKTGLKGSDRRKYGYDKVIEYITRLCYAYIYQVKAHQ